VGGDRITILMKTKMSDREMWHRQEERRRRVANTPRPQRTNRYPGQCSHCGNHVPAGEGRLLRQVDDTETRTTVYKWYVYCPEGKH
jgi:hypothetical protein